MTERTYTKGEIMAALNALKKPTEAEMEHGDVLSNTDPVRCALVGAEALVYAIEGGEYPRDHMTNEITRSLLLSLITDESPRLAKILGLGVAEEAEKVTTPPEGDA